MSICGSNPTSFYITTRHPFSRTILGGVGARLSQTPALGGVRAKLTPNPAPGGVGRISQSAACG